MSSIKGQSASTADITGYGTVSKRGTDSASMDQGNGQYRRHLHQGAGTSKARTISGEDSDYRSRESARFGEGECWMEESTHFHILLSFLC